MRDDDRVKSGFVLPRRPGTTDPHTARDIIRVSFCLARSPALSNAASASPCHTYSKYLRQIATSREGIDKGWVVHPDETTSIISIELLRWSVVLTLFNGDVESVIESETNDSGYCDMRFPSDEPPTNGQEPSGFPIAVIWISEVDFIAVILVELAIEIFSPSILLIWKPRGLSSHKSVLPLRVSTKF
ncbi:hypothetical protein G5I_14331 [Acromyrmex echinatior]|uniref:Uncharacterized protein n=1 Tax=Acromyrmex echinatior TaxID=103372 RepID=F4X7F2_ACREC|nr:hypothetical protein G5I_14331 [Acromyrmex echinatior]